MSGSTKIIAAIDVGELFEDVPTVAPKGYHSVAEIATATGRATSTVSRRMTDMRRAGKVDGMKIANHSGGRWMYRVNL